MDPGFSRREGGGGGGGGSEVERKVTVCIVSADEIFPQIIMIGIGRGRTPGLLSYFQMSEQHLGEIKRTIFLWCWIWR